jgi:hypothetical protein
VAVQLKGPLAVVGSGPLFLRMIDVPSDEAGGVFGHGSLACLGGSDHGGLQLDLLGGHFGVGLARGGPEGIFGGTLGGLELADGGECHGWRCGGGLPPVNLM